MTEKGYPKYQYSLFDLRWKGDQIVIRSDDREEMLELLGCVKKMKLAIEKLAVKTGTLLPSGAPTAQAGVCPVHGTAWVLKPAGVSRTTNRVYPAFWACSCKNADGSFCNQKPAKTVQPTPAPVAPPPPPSAPEPVYEPKDEDVPTEDIPF